MNRSIVTGRLVFLITLLLLSACGRSGGGGSSSTTTLISPVAVSAVFPAEARAGESITISGQKFGATQGASTLSINGVSVTQITSWSDTQIQAIVPVAATTGNVTVSVDGVAGAPGHLIVLWQATNPVNVPVTVASGDQTEFQSVSDDAGGAIVVWTDSRNGNKDIYAQRLNNAGVPQWTTDGVAVSAAAGDQSVPQLIADGAGGAVIVWKDGRDLATTANDIYAQHLNGAGLPQWTANGVAVSTTASDQQSPQLIAGGAGGAIVAWRDVDLTAATIRAQRLNGAGLPQWTAGGVGVNTLAVANTILASPQLISDGQDGAFIVWTAFGGGNSGMWAQRINAAGVTQWNQEVQVSSASATFAKPVTDGGDGLIVVWNLSSGVRAQRLNGSGVLQWTGNGLSGQVVAASANVDIELFPIPDGVGGMIVAWSDFRGGNNDIYAQRVNNAGVPQWAANGVAVSTAANTQIFPRLLPDGASGAIVVWQDARTVSTSKDDIYAQHINDAGALQWLGTTAVSTASGEQLGPQIVADGYGGAIVVWQDARNGNQDIYAQNITANGRQ